MDQLGPISLATGSTQVRSADPSAPWGVGTQRKTNSAPAPPLRAGPRTAAAALDALGDQFAQPVLHDGRSPRCSVASLAGSRSAHTTWWPKWARRGRRGQPHVARADHRHRAPAAGRVACATPGRRVLTGPRRLAQGAPPAGRGPSCQSGSSGRPARPQRRVVEHRVGRAGGRPGRVELGGGDRRHPAGVVAGRRQHGPHEPEPGGRPLLVTWKMPGRRSSGQGDDAAARSAVKVGRSPLVVDEAQRPGSAAGQPQDGPDHVGAVDAAHPEVRTMVARPDRHLLFATRACSGRRPTAGRGRPTRRRAGRGAVEDVVGRDVDQVGADGAGPPRPRGGCPGR